MGGFLFQGYANGQYQTVADLSVIVDAGVAGAKVPSSFTISTLNQSNSYGERMRITSGGNLGLGTTTPGGFLSVSTATSSPGFLMSYTGTGNAVYIQDEAGDKSPFVITGAGNVGIGTTTPATTTAIHGALLVAGMISGAQLTATGTVTFPGLPQSAAAQTYTVCGDSAFRLIFETSATACAVSAEKFKTDIMPLNIGLKELLKVEAVSYKLKDQTLDKTDHIGVIADQVLPIESRLITYDINGDTHGFDYLGFTAWIQNSIKDFYAEFRRLLARVSGLEKRLNKQEAEIQELRLEINKLKK